MRKTFIELVNDTVDEAKITLDPLTPQNFHNPPRTEMYNRVKRWLNEALEELLTARNEWFSRKERAVVELYPRVQLLAASVPPAVGYTYTGQVSGVSFTVLKIHTDENVAGEPDMATTLSVSFVDDDTGVQSLAINEPMDIVSPIATTNAAIFKGNGFYNLARLISGAERVDGTSICIYPSLEDQMDGVQFTEMPAIPISWGKLGTVRSGYGIAQPNTGRYVTQTPLGTHSFYPPFSKPVIAEMDYTKGFVKMVNHDDVPTCLPDEYHQYLMWAAVRAYGDFQQSQLVWARGDKNAEKFIVRMERDLSPKVTMGSVMFNVS